MQLGRTFDELHAGLSDKYHLFFDLCCNISFQFSVNQVLPLNDLLDMADLAGAVGGTGAKHRFVR